MKIYLLKQLKPGYDEFEAKVVVANSHMEARILANVHTADEGKIWKDTTLVVCTEVSLHVPEVCFESFKAG